MNTKCFTLVAIIVLVGCIFTRLQPMKVPHPLVHNSHWYCMLLIFVSCVYKCSFCNADLKLWWSPWGVVIFSSVLTSVQLLTGKWVSSSSGMLVCSMLTFSETVCLLIFRDHGGWQTAGWRDWVWSQEVRGGTEEDCKASDSTQCHSTCTDGMFRGLLIVCAKFLFLQSSNNYNLWPYFNT